MIRIEEFRKNDCNKFELYSVKEFDPKHIKSGKFNKFSQLYFDSLLKTLSNEHKIKIQNIEIKNIE